MIEATHIIGLASLYRFQWEEAQQCHVLLYPEGMIKLNGSAGEILKYCDNQRSVADIITVLKEQFPQVEGLDADVTDFLEAAHANGWITLK